MLANARSLIELASDPHCEQRCAGQLHMRQDGIWRPAYGILKFNLLFIYAKQDDTEAPFFLLIMEDCTVEPADDNLTGMPFSFDIRMKTTGRTFQLAADSNDALDRWISSLTVCSMDYITATLQAYQEQIDKAGRNKTTESRKESLQAKQPDEHVVKEEAQV